MWSLTFRGWYSQAPGCTARSRIQRSNRSIGQCQNHLGMPTRLDQDRGGVGLAVEVLGILEEPGVEAIQMGLFAATIRSLQPQSPNVDCGCDCDDCARKCQ
jgi:hypothetical protein